MKKQSAYAPPEHRSSNCPSPTPSSLSAGTNKGEGDDGAAAGGTRIVDGKILRADEESQASSTVQPPSELLAEKTGATGVQRNAAIGVQSPGVGYWALNAGGGARLDGKAPTPLKDKSGAEVDLRKIRAEAAARRAVEQAKVTASLPTTGKTIKGEEVEVDNNAAAAAAGKAPTRKNRSRTAGKYSKLKNAGGTAFHGGSNQF